MLAFEAHLKAEGQRLGFDLVGIAPPIEPPGYPRLLAWLNAKLAGEMSYMYRHRAARAHPRSVLGDVRSLVVAAMSYAPPRANPPVPRQDAASLGDPTSPGTPRDVGSDCQDTSAPLLGRVARYAQGPDYHEVLRSRLNLLLSWIREQRPQCHGRAVVDTAPLLERDFARLAGLGWFGKNTMLLNRKLGSWFFLGALLLDIELQPDPPHETSHCGACTACLDACPTQAFPEPGVLDSRRCISYLTIELRTPIPPSLREPMGDWIIGCDICQEVCPWNRKATPSGATAFSPRDDLATPDLLGLLGLTDEEFRNRFRGTALTRPRRRGLLRNVAIALGNRRATEAVPALLRALEDAEPLIRGAAAWALGRIGGDAAVNGLRNRAKLEADQDVSREIAEALGALGTGRNPPSGAEVRPE